MTREVLKFLGAVLIGILLVALAIGGADAGLVNLSGMTIVIFAFVVSETRKLWTKPNYWGLLGLAFVAHSGAVLLIVKRYGATFPTVYDIVFGVPEMIGLCFLLRQFADGTKN